MPIYFWLLCCSVLLVKVPYRKPFFVCFCFCILYSWEYWDRLPFEREKMKLSSIHRHHLNTFWKGKGADMAWFATLFPGALLWVPLWILWSRLTGWQFRWRRCGSLLMGLRTLDPRLNPQSTPAVSGGGRANNFKAILSTSFFPKKQQQKSPPVSPIFVSPQILFLKTPCTISEP